MSDNSLRRRSSRSRSLRPPSSDGSAPSSPLSYRNSAVGLPDSSVVTPYHDETGSSVSQLVLIFQFGPPVASYRATRASRTHLYSRVTNSPMVGMLRLMAPIHATKTGSSGAHSPVRYHRKVSSGRLTNASGIGPVNPSLSLTFSPSRLARFPSSGGTTPLSSLPESDRPSRLARSPSSGGISPLSAFPPRFRLQRVPRSPSAGGIGPLSWLLPRSRRQRFARFPSWGGISPLSSFPPRLRLQRLARLPSSGGTRSMMSRVVHWSTPARS